MVNKISAVINTYNEENRIQKLIESLNWADEVVVVDDGSTDGTLAILQRLSGKNGKLKFFKNKGAGFVEPARNFAISKATSDWILILDADEEIEQFLVTRLQEIARSTKKIDYVRLPRKNLIFRHVLMHSGWWPDYNIRFFKKGLVKWTDEIHRPPQVSGVGLDFPAEEKYAILHYSYATISQFIERMDKYTTIQAEEIKRGGYQFAWKDLFDKPLNEFLSRFFVMEGYKDGIIGLALSFLQAFSFLVVFLKVWEMEKFKGKDITLQEVQNQKKESAQAIDYWFNKSKSGESFLGKLFKRK